MPQWGFSRFNGNGDWVLDSSRYRNFLGERKIYNPPGNFRYIIYSDKINRGKIAKINSANEKSVRYLNNFFNDRFHESKINYYIYDNFEDKGLISGNTQLSNIDWEDSSIHVVINDWIKGNDFSKTAKLIIRKNLGQPKYKFLENGLHVYFSHNWRKEGYEFWSGFLSKAGQVPALNELLDNKEFDYISYLFSEPLGAAFVSFLIHYKGKNNFIKLYKSRQPEKNELLKLSSKWNNYLKHYASKYKAGLINYHKDFSRKVPSFQKGFCFAHEGYQIYNGYLSRDAVKSIQKMMTLGINSFSITPFTSMRNTSKPEPLRFWEFSGAENDESIIHLVHNAEKLQLNTILKPHIYIGRNGWSGQIKMTNKKDWHLFFHNYYNWISHYAMLAEMYRIPILCVGNELSGTTVGHQKEWINIVKKIRKFYDGKITYGPNWSNEFEDLTFWKYFDFIGISEYFPLSTENNPSDNDLLLGAKKVMERIKKISDKYHKKVIFTEVGFRSSAEPWKTALEKDGKDSVNLQSQARCYSAIFKAAFGKKWLAGMYWWKWPSDLSIRANFYNKNYTPLNKPAENIVKEWYSKTWKSSKR